MIFLTVLLCDFLGWCQHEIGQICEVRIVGKEVNACSEHTQTIVVRALEEKTALRSVDIGTYRDWAVVNEAFSLVLKISGSLFKPHGMVLLPKRILVVVSTVVHDFYCVI